MQLQITDKKTTTTCNTFTHHYWNVIIKHPSAPQVRVALGVCSQSVVCRSWGQASVICRWGMCKWVPFWLLPFGQMSSSAWPVWQRSSAVIGSSAARVPSPLAGFTYRREVPGIDVVNILINKWATFLEGRILIVLQTTPFAERKGLVTLQPSSCPHGRNLMWPIRSALFILHIRCHGEQLCHNLFSGCQHLIN